MSHTHVWQGWHMPTQVRYVQRLVSAVWERPVMGILFHVAAAAHVQQVVCGCAAQWVCSCLGHLQ
jgi:hypothetical protein